MPSTKRMRTSIPSAAYAADSAALIGKQKKQKKLRSYSGHKASFACKPLATSSGNKLRLISSQVCLAYRCEGSKRSRCAVVLCQREKLQMEAEFRRVIPEARRCGTRFVFRQGLPLIPDDLRQVAASQAAATIVISDSSRSAIRAARLARAT